MHYIEEISVRDLQHRLREVLDRIASGDTVVVRRRGTPIARIVPYQRLPESAVPWPDLAARLRAIYGSTVIADATSDLIYHGRGG